MFHRICNFGEVVETMEYFCGDILSDDALSRVECVMCVFLTESAVVSVTVNRQAFTYILCNNITKLNVALNSVIEQRGKRMN